MPATIPVAGVKATPAGSVPVVNERVGVGAPVAVTVKLPGEATVKVAALTLVIIGAAPSVSMKDAEMGPGRGRVVPPQVVSWSMETMASGSRTIV